MSEKQTFYEDTPQVNWHETGRGTLVEHQTSPDGDGNSRRVLGTVLKREVVMSPDAWRFSGPHGKETAEATLIALNSMVNVQPDMAGRYAVTNLREPADSSLANADEDLPYIITVAGIDSQSPAEVAQRTRDVVGEFNQFSPDWRNDVQLPLPPAVE